MNNMPQLMFNLQVYKKKKFSRITGKYLESNGIKLNDAFYEQWKFDLEKRKLVYLGITDSKKIESIYHLLIKNKYFANVSLINTQHLFCVCFEDKNEFSGLILSLKQNYVSIDQGIFNQSRHEQIIDELTNYCENNDIQSLMHIDEISTSLICVGDFQIISEAVGISYPEIEYTFTLNTHKEYIRYYLDFIKRSPFQKPRHHIERFCRLYYLVIRIIAEIIPNSTSISVHDVGTNVAQFPLLLSGLSREQLLGISIHKIIASDCQWMANAEINKIIERNPHYKKIDFIKLDIVKQIKKIPRADVTIAIDVFEHLKNDEVCLKSLSALWGQTRKVLVIHVPFESELSKGWGHNICFNSAKLKKWQRCLPDAQLISDKFYEYDEATLLEHGFLVMRRRNKNNKVIS